MIYARFLEFVLNILFILVGTGIIALFITIAFFLIKGTASPKNKIESPEELEPEPARRTRLNLTEDELQEILFELEKEKRAVALGFNNLPPIHQEANKARFQKIEKRLHYVKLLLSDGNLV